jgi:chromosomal replication initiation ATPase DnaA
MNPNTEVSYMAMPGLPRHQFTPNALLNAFCDVSEIPYDKLRAKDRSRILVEARQTLMRLLHLNFPNKLSYSVIANMVGLSNHATTIHGIKNTDNLLQTSSSYRTFYMGIVNGINNKLGVSINYSKRQYDPNGN